MDKLIFQYSKSSDETNFIDSSKTTKQYIDFIVSGQSLGQLFGLSNNALIGTFGWTENIKYENNQIDEFSGVAKPELQTGRTSFYVCSECGDIGCGAITALIEVKDTVITWKNFGYENGIDEPDLTDYKEIGPFHFNKDEYIRTLEELRR